MEQERDRQYSTQFTDIVVEMISGYAMLAGHEVNDPDDLEYAFRGVIGISDDLDADPTKWLLHPGHFAWNLLDVLLCTVNWRRVYEWYSTVYEKGVGV